MCRLVFSLTKHSIPFLLLLSCWKLQHSNQPLHDAIKSGSSAEVSVFNQISRRIIILRRGALVVVVVGADNDDDATNGIVCKCVPLRVEVGPLVVF